MKSTVRELTQGPVFVPKPVTQGPIVVSQKKVRGRDTRARDFVFGFLTQQLVQVGMMQVGTARSLRHYKPFVSF